jgi:hypothetical protein
LECVKNFTGNAYPGCTGGRPEWIWDYSRTQGGAAYEASHTLYNQISTAACQAGVTKDVRSEVDYWVQIANLDEEAMKCRIANHGPIHVSISIERTSLESYASGLWSDPECATRTIDHAVYLVGYGSELNQAGVMTDYWIIQNSWGTSYGSGGFFKIKRGINLCLVATDARYPVLKSATPPALEPIYALTGCLLSGDVWSTDGTYQKSFCIDNYVRNYEASRLACLAKGGRLYTFDTPEATFWLFNTTDTAWTKKNIVVDLYTSGQSGSGCQYITNNNPFGNVSEIESN